MLAYNCVVLLTPLETSTFPPFSSLHRLVLLLACNIETGHDQATHDQAAS